MELRCKKCNKLMGDVVNGSRLRKGLVVLCKGCFGADQTKIAAAEFARGASPSSAGLDLFSSILNPQ